MALVHVTRVMRKNVFPLQFCKKKSYFDTSEKPLNPSKKYTYIIEIQEFFDDIKKNIEVLQFIFLYIEKQEFFNNILKYIEKLYQKIYFDAAEKPLHPSKKIHIIEKREFFQNWRVSVK